MAGQLSVTATGTKLCPKGNFKVNDVHYYVLITTLWLCLSICLAVCPYDHLPVCLQVSLSVCIMLRVEIIKLNSKAVNAVAAYRPPNCKGFFESLENLVRICDV